MDLLTVTFPVSGVTTNLLLPPLVSLFISFFTSMAGISGAFLLLPFQMSVLHYTAPSVSGTNHVFNVIAIPSGVYRYIKEDRMAWPLTGVIIGGTLPGVFLGYSVRVRFLPDPELFKFFAGCVLAYIGMRLARELVRGAKAAGGKGVEEKFKARAGIPGDAVVRTISVSINKVEYEFRGERYSFNTMGMTALAFVVGIVGGAYGIGGGAIIAPFCVAFFHLPVYTIAGATLMGTFITSMAGAIFFSLIPVLNGVSAMPDWPLGILLGAGGFIGMYLGARLQKFAPQKIIKTVLAIVILSLALRYIAQYLF